MTNRFKQARKDAVMTQEHLAAAAGVSVSTVRRLETENIASPESRRAIAAVLGIDVFEVRGTGRVETVKLKHEPFYFVRRRDMPISLMLYAMFVVLGGVAAYRAIMTIDAEWSIAGILVGCGIVMSMGLGAMEIPHRPWRSSSFLSTLGTTAFLYWLFFGVGYLFVKDWQLPFVMSGWIAGALFLFIIAMLKRVVFVDAGTPRVGGSLRRREISRYANSPSVLVIV